MSRERILRELEILQAGGQVAELVSEGREFVIYRAVPSNGAQLGLPTATDAIVPVPNGYPASTIDLAGLPVGSPLLQRVKGGQNCQGVVTVAGVNWHLASYHPHSNGYLTGMAGALAAGYAIGWITGRFDPPFLRLQMNLVAPYFDVQDVFQDARSYCVCRRIRGWADQAQADALISAPQHWTPAIRLT